jgi:hypothetical protein
MALANSGHEVVHHVLYEARLDALHDLVPALDGHAREAALSATSESSSCMQASSTEERLVSSVRISTRVAIGALG